VPVAQDELIRDAIHEMVDRADVAAPRLQPGDGELT
jgi:hypothetical protein